MPTAAVAFKHRIEASAVQGSYRALMRLDWLQNSRGRYCDQTDLSSAAPRQNPGVGSADHACDGKSTGDRTPQLWRKPSGQETSGANDGRSTIHKRLTLPAQFRSSSMIATRTLSQIRR